MRLRFAIVGAGLTGTSMLFQFVERLASRSRDGAVDPRRVQIRIFERQPMAGPGFPHNGRFVETYHVTNMCAEEMGVSYQRPGDFSDWVEQRRPELETAFPELGAVLRDPAYRQADCGHYPRALMGEYLAARFSEAVARARRLGVEVEVLTECEITNIEETEQGIRLEARSQGAGGGFRCPADQVLLATGHWARPGSGPGYFSSPWPARHLLRGIPPGASVGVVGSGLSAIETALTLSSDGRFVRSEAGELIFAPAPSSRRITLLSRHGLLPRVRAPALSYEPRFFNRLRLQSLLARHPEGLALARIVHLFERELRAATGRRLDWRSILQPQAQAQERLLHDLEGIRPVRDNDLGLWQSILRQAFPLARDLYLALSPADRIRFEREYATLFFVHAATQPPVNAEKMLALMRAGILTVERLGSSYRVEGGPDGTGFRFRYGDAGNRRAEFRYLVDARGQDCCVFTDDSTLTRNLIRSGTVQVGEAQVPEQGPDQPLVAVPTSQKPRPACASVRIDPRSHRVMQGAPGGTLRPSPWLYAVGAMTRAQILDVSMARSLARSTDRVAEQLVGWLVRNP